MRLERGNMWDIFGKTDLFLITTNPIVKKNGAAVMGAGIAKQAALRFPELPFDFGKLLVQTQENYGYINTDIIGVYENQRVGYFMVKEHWAEAAKLDIIAMSVQDLYSSFCLGEGDRPYRIDLNFPGIGNGKLKREDVLPLLEVLPDNVCVWEYA